MVFCNSWSTLLQSHMAHFSLLLITFNFFLIIPQATSLSFDLPTIGPQNQNRDLKPEGDGAYISDQGIQVTPDEVGADRNQKAGRAIYISPLHLWDNASGELASFTTNFSFVIDSRGSPDRGDGLAFFMASNNSDITRGGAMGLPIHPEKLYATAKFVAVEFDTYPNGWDPKYSTNYPDGDHVGINISNLTSVVSAKWFSNVTSGKENEAWINYNSTSKNLSVVFTGFRNNNIFSQYGLHYTVDLRDELPEWVIFGFSAATGASFEKNNVKSWSFNSSVLQIDENKGPTNPRVETLAPTPYSPDPITTIPKKWKSKIGLVVGLTIGLCVLVGGLVLACFGLWKKRRKENYEIGFDDVNMDDEFEMGSGPKKFSYGELARATSYFAEEEKLGEGGFGGVYRGFLRELNSYVAVKRVSNSSKQGIKEYASEVKIISRLRHRNLVQLIGWCHEKRELLLVYELMANGSLDSHLFKEKSLLTWGVRCKIAQGLASALLYLHEEWEQCVLHRDIKSSNIMLDTNFNAKLGDFGLARLVDHEKGSQTTVLAGTMGYMAPECVITGKSSKESDVFSFGIVALEIACGRRPIDLKAQENQIRMVEWVWELYGMEKLLEAADPTLNSDFDEQEMERLIIVGLWCAYPDKNSRPSIRQAIHVLNFEAPLPILPSKMPVATYSIAPSTSMATASTPGATDSESSQIQSSSYTYNTDSSKFSTSSAASSSSPSAALLYSK